MIRTHSTGEAAEIFGAPSERWYIEQIRSGRFPGRKIGKKWRVTDNDILTALNICRNEQHVADPEVLPVVGLTPRSKQRLSKSARLEGGGDDAA